MTKRILKSKPLVEGSQIYLRKVALSDVNDDYHRWMNDPEVTQFLEVRNARRTHQDILDYVKSVLKKSEDVFLAICVKETGQHIGNIKLGPVNQTHSFAHIGLLIGEKNFWGKGLATEAISLVVQYAFNTLKLHKVLAGCYANNAASARAFEKAGFTREGLQKSQWLCGSQYVDGILFGLINPAEKKA
jgi:ribosomal-protein-alanine N-acetyltransferase